MCVWVDDGWDALSTVLRSQSVTSGHTDGDEMHGGSSQGILFQYKEIN